MKTDPRFMHVVAALIYTLLILCVAMPEGAHAATNSSNSSFFSLRISGSQWGTALANNYTEVASAVRTSLATALDEPEENIIVLSLTVGSLVALFYLHSSTLTSAQVISSVIAGPISVIEAVYRSTTSSTETLTILSVAEENESVTCGRVCIALSVSCSIVGLVLLVAVVWWVFRMICRPPVADGGNRSVAPLDRSEFDAPVPQHPIEQWQQQQLRPEHYKRDDGVFSGPSREMSHYNPGSTYTVSPRSVRMSRASLRSEPAALSGVYIPHQASNTVSQQPHEQQQYYIINQAR